MGTERKARRVAFGDFENSPGDAQEGAAQSVDLPASPAAAAGETDNRIEDPREEHLHPTADTPAEEEADTDSEAKSKKRLSSAELLMLAQTGGMRERQKLTQHPNDTIAEAAISTPGLPDVAIAAIAENTTTNPVCFKVIASNPRWSKTQNIVKALAFNPKTPVHVSRGLLPLLRKDVLEKICSNRELPDGLRALARKKLSKKH